MTLGQTLKMLNSLNILLREICDNGTEQIKIQVISIYKKLV